VTCQACHTPITFDGAVSRLGTYGGQEGGAGRLLLCGECWMAELLSRNSHTLIWGDKKRYQTLGESRCEECGITLYDTPMHHCEWCHYLLTGEQP